MTENIRSGAENIRSRSKNIRSFPDCYESYKFRFLNGSCRGPYILADRIFFVKGPYIFSEKTVYFQNLRTVYFTSKDRIFFAKRPYIFSFGTVYFQPGPYILLVTRFHTCVGVCYTRLRFLRGRFGRRLKDHGCTGRNKA